MGVVKRCLRLLIVLRIEDGSLVAAIVIGCLPFGRRVLSTVRRYRLMDLTELTIQALVLL